MIDQLSYGNGSDSVQAILNKALLSNSSTAAFRAIYQQADPFPHVVFNNLFSDEFLEKLIEDFDDVSFSDWLRFDSDQETKRATRSNARLGTTSQTYFDSIHRANFIRFLSDISGIPGLIPDPVLFGGGLHEIPSGGKFAVHTDFNKHPTTRLDTRLVFITYLNKDWLASYGGQLELWDREKSLCIRKIIPEFGTSILFNNSVHSLHGHPNPVNAPEGRTRRSIAAYFYTNGRPDEHDEGGQTTRFHQPVSVGRYGRAINMAKYCLPPATIDAIKWVNNVRR